MAKGSTTEAVRALVQPYAEQLGLRIWDVTFTKEGASWYLRIYIDKDGGVNIDDCAAMSRAVDEPLDEADPIDQAYFLEVCSPGIERELRREEHFAAYIGQKVKVRLIRAADGVREFSGVLKDFQDGVLTVETSQGSITFNKKDAAHINADDFGG
ncbi:MAG: ribosome maturation factor RimP [Clostridia bacterium]